MKKSKNVRPHRRSKWPVLLVLFVIAAAAVLETWSVTGAVMDRQARTIRVECDVPVEWTLDGEREPETNVVVMDNLHSAVRIVIPPYSTSAPFDNSEEEAEL